MESPTAVFPTRIPTRTSDLPEVTVPPRLRPAGHLSRRWFPSARWVNWFATAALLLVTLIGASLALLAPRGEGGGTATVPAVAPIASPSPGSAGSYQCPPGSPYFGCANARVVGSAGISPSFLPDADREARKVQLQAWTLAPGTAVTGVGESDVTTGVVVDFVLAGAYVATFDVPVIVSRANISGFGASSSQYPGVGNTVELGRGDAVTYQLGGLTEIHNPMSIQHLEFKRAVIYKGDISAFSTSYEGVTTRVEGNTELSQATGSLSTDLGFTLYFINVVPGFQFPPSQWTDSTSIGPVDPQNSPAGSRGFVLVIRPPQG